MKNKSKSRLLVLPIILSVIGVAALGFGIANFAREEAWFAKAKQAQGTITAYDLNVRNDGLSDYCPRIEFTTQTGEAATSYGDICPNRPDESQIGKTLTVYYDPANPSDTRSKGWAGEEGSGLIGGVVGFVFFLALGWGSYLAARLAANARARKKGSGELSPLMLQDAARYRANQQAAERAQKKTQKN
jgi:hypothetical protein